MLLMQTLQVGNNTLALIMLSCTMAAFHFATLEEYYTGTLFLPPINGVGEGSVFAMILYTISGFTGNGIWASEMFSVSFLGIDGLEIMHTGQFLILLMSLAAFSTMILAFVTVFRTKTTPHRT